MFRRLKSQRLKNPIVYAGICLAVLAWSGIGLGIAAIAAADGGPAIFSASTAILMAAGCLTSALIILASLRISTASHRLALNEARIKNSSRRIARQRQQLESSSKTKRDFLAALSHELRTPLGGIIGMSRILLEQEINSSQRQSIQTIATSSEALLVIVNDILEYSKIKAGKLTLRHARFNLKVLLRDILALIAAEKSGNEAWIVLDYAAGIPAWFTGDAGRIRQIVINLLGNAVKFAPGGRIVLAVSATGSNGRFDVVVAVSDSGPGIPADRIEGIFEEFVQLDIAAHNKASGTGLGLPISKNLAELMDGQIYVRSGVGVGSTFTLKVPLAPADPAIGLSPVGQAMPPNEPPMVRLRAGRPIRILAAEDNQTNRQILTSMLKTENVLVTLACDGNEAIELFLAAAPDLILMDVGMPQINGFEATGQIRNLELIHGLKRTPIIALTANAMRGDRDKCLAANMDDYMSKPLLKKKLTALLAKWCNTDDGAANMPLFERDQRQLGNVARSIEGRQRPPASVVDEIRIAELINDLGLETFCQISDQFTRDMDDALETLAACVTSSNSGQIRVTLHLIRGCAANLGAARIVQICDQMHWSLDGTNGHTAGVVDELISEFGKTKTRLSAVLAPSPRP